MTLSSRRLRRVITTVAIMFLSIPVALFVIAWLGIYNVGASRGHWPITEWLLEFGMRHSVATHSLSVDAPPLNDENMIRLGAAHFHGACAQCHGAPGIARNPLVRGMLPEPPDLSVVSEKWRDRELFWIVKHGIKYTGMPAWPSLARDDEVWAVTAFLRRLPSLDAAGYRDLAMGDVTLPREDGRGVALGLVTEQAAGACARCHGAGASGPRSNLVPVLHGQPAAFLLDALRNFAAGTRESGIMQTIAADLTFDTMQRVAEYYSGLKPPASPPRNEAASTENGRVIATEGLADVGIPPCLACHGPEALPTYPRLAGQRAAYMKAQLRLWRRDVNARTQAGAIMAPIARRLNERQIEETAAFFEAFNDAPSTRQNQP